MVFEHRIVIFKIRAEDVGCLLDDRGEGHDVDHSPQIMTTGSRERGVTEQTIYKWHNRDSMDDRRLPNRRSRMR